MAESSKYSAFIDELNSLEKQIYVFQQQYEEIAGQKSALEKKINQLEQERDVLKLKYEELESEINNFRSEDFDLSDTSYINSEDREQLKSKISDLISKIDHHLRT